MDTHCNDFLSDQLRNQVDIVPFPTDTHKESDWVEEVAEYSLESEERTVDIDVSSPPRQECIDERDKSDDAQKRSDDGKGDLNTKSRSFRERVQGIFGFVFSVRRDGDGSGCERFLDFGVTEFGYGERGGDGHDTGRNEDFGVETESYVTDQDGSGDGLYISVLHCEVNLESAKLTAKPQVIIWWSSALVMWGYTCQP